jgi:hypothetical protein
MGSGGSRVVPRVQALLGPAPRQRPALVLAAGALVAFALVTALHAQEDGDAWFDHAGATAHGTVAHAVHAPALRPPA